MRGQCLTFVPNFHCNFGCSYCYLGKMTDKKENTTDMAESFKKIATKLKSEEVIITEVFLHGAELTTAAFEDVKKLLEAIWEYKEENENFIDFFNRKDKTPFIKIKTNLYRLDEFLKLFEKYQVFISGSVDLPLKMHEKYRRLKNGKSSLEKILQNIKLLSAYPYEKQLSATMSAEHIKVDEFIADIKKLDEMGFDMAKNFYIMFAYQTSNARALFKMAEDKAMLEFYKELRLKLKGSKYEFATEHLWFKEFLGGYCTNCTNCARFKMLIQKNGDCYVCHRSQALKELKSGNIFEQSYDEIKQRAILNIQKMENSLELHKDCFKCEHFYLCKASCTVERNDTKLGKSFTCALQKEIYKNNPSLYPANKELSLRELDIFLRENQLLRHKQARLPNLSAELLESQNNLENLINNDEILKQSFDKSNFYIGINDKVSELCFEKDEFQRLRILNAKDKITLFIKKSALDINAKERLSNYIWIALLGGENHRYGDENRLKIPHIATEYVYYNKLLNEGKDFGEYFAYDISAILQKNTKSLNVTQNQRNFLFFTTHQMRKYHYEKHAKNAFYHIQALNLPFARLEFLWDESEV